MFSPGHEVAEQMLKDNGITDVTVCFDIAVPQRNYYSVGKKQIWLHALDFQLSTAKSTAAAIHEVAHAIQHKELYLPFMLKIFLDPVFKSKRLTRIVEWDATNRALYWLLKSDIVNSDDFQTIKEILANCLKTYN